MVLRAILVLTVILSACVYFPRDGQSDSVRKEASTAQEKFKTGLSIEYGTNLGATHTDSEGQRHFYVHNTAVITNDSTIPIQLNLALAKEMSFPDFCGESTYKVFTLPGELTPDTSTVYNNIVNGTHDFLNAPLKNTKEIKKTLQPDDICLVTIGVLIQKPANCAAVPRAVFSLNGTTPDLECERQNNEGLPDKMHSEVGIKLEYYYNRKFVPPDDGCVVIPIGQISYLKE